MAFYSSIQSQCFFFDYEVDILDQRRPLYLLYAMSRLFAVTRDKVEKPADYSDPP
jgi:hypothetical protein